MAARCEIDLSPGKTIAPRILWPGRMITRGILTSQETRAVAGSYAGLACKATIGFATARLERNCRLVITFQAASEWQTPDDCRRQFVSFFERHMTNTARSDNHSPRLPAPDGPTS